MRQKFGIDPNSTPHACTQGGGSVSGDLDADLVACCIGVGQNASGGAVVLLTERPSDFEPRLADADAAAAVAVARTDAFLNYIRRQPRKT